MEKDVTELQWILIWCHDVTWGRVFANMKKTSHTDTSNLRSTIYLCLSLMTWSRLYGRMTFHLQKSTFHAFLTETTPRGLPYLLKMMSFWWEISAHCKMDAIRDSFGHSKVVLPSQLFFMGRITDSTFSKQI